MEKYKDTIYSRYFILREGLFKNTKKILNIAKEYIIIENLDDKNYKEIIKYEDIITIKISDNAKDFKIHYYLKDNEIKETSQAFTSSLRTQVVCDIWRQIDLLTKVNHFPVETFKCFLFLEESIDIIKSFGLEGINVVNKNNNANILDINLNIYRSMIEWVCFLSKRETRIRLSDIEQIKVYDINNEDIIFFKVETFNKIDLCFLSKKMDEYKAIIDKILDNAKNVLGIDIVIDHIDIKDFIKPNASPKIKIFCYSTYKILYNSSKRFVRMTGDYEYIYENYENIEGVITKINKIPLTQIVYIICYENESEFFEIVLKSNARYLYQTLEQERNIIITSIINLLSINNKEEHNFILLSDKPKYGLKVMGFIYEEVDWEYDRNICLSLNSENITNEIREKIVEDICLNFSFKSQKFKIETIFQNNKKSINSFFSTIFDLLKKELDFLKLINIEENKVEYFKRIYVINLYLILYKSLITKSHNDKIYNDLVYVLDNINLQTIFYNSVSIFRSLLPNQAKYLKKEEIAQKKWIVSFHLGYGKKIKTLLYSKIYDKKLTYENFENQNILIIFVLMELFKNINEFSKEINIVNEIIKEINSYDFIHILYMLIRCNSSIMIQISLEILIILLKNLTYEQEFSLKQIILKRSFIFLVLIKIYLKSPSEVIVNLALKFIKSFIISHVEATNIILNLFPATLFYYIDKNKPNPINWQDDQWCSFFKILTRDFNSTQLIWNEYCRKELLDFIDNVIINYENFSQNYNIIHLMKMGECVVDTTNKDLKESINPYFYCLNYKELKLEYQSLKKYYFVWKYYLRRIIVENLKPNLQVQIDKPKKFWKKIIEEIIHTNVDWKVILLLKSLTLLYKNYFSTIGPLKNFEYFMNIFCNRSLEIKSQIVQFLYVICDVEDNEIKNTNINNLIHLDGLQKLINFIPHLINIDYLENSLEKFSFEELIIEKPLENNSNELEAKEKILNSSPKRILNNNEKPFINYTNYTRFHSSWDSAESSINICAILIKLLKLVDISYSKLNESDNNKILYPIPKVRSILMDENNFSIMFLILFCKNENLTHEFLELIFYNMNDPLSFKNAISKTNISDLLIFYLLKNKNPIILNYFEKISRYQNIIFNFDEFIKNLDVDEKEYIKVYSNTNLFLMKYFPINMIYVYNFNDFNELMKILFQDNINCSSLIWNNQMLKSLIQSLKLKFECFIKVKLRNYYNSINIDMQSNFVNFPRYEFEENYRYIYKEINNKTKAFIYYLENFLVNKEIHINDEKEDKNANLSQTSLVKRQNLFSNNIFEDHIVIVYNNIIVKINKIKELNENKSELYTNELKIYFKSFLKLIKCYDIKILNYTDHFNEIFDIYCKKEKVTENEEKILRIILKIVYVSIVNIEIKSNENLRISGSNLNLLFKGFIFYIKKFSQIESDTSLDNLIKIITSIIQIINRIPSSIENQDFSLLEIFNSLITQLIYNNFLLKALQKVDLPLNNSLINLFLCILEMLYVFSKITIYAISLIKSGIILELLLFSLFFDKKKQKESEFINQIAKKASVIINSLIFFSIKQKDDPSGNQNTRSLCKDFYDSVLHLIGSHIFSNLTKINFNKIKSSLSSTFEYEKDILSFLISLKSNYELPDFKWYKSVRKEIKLYLNSLIEKIISEKNSSLIFNEIKSYSFRVFENEFIINNIYVKLYNKDPNWKIKECDLFLENIKQVFLKLNEPSYIKLNENIDFVDKNIDMIYAMSNCISYSKANEKILTSDKIFGDKLINLFKESNSQILIIAILNLLYIYSEKTNSLKFILNSSVFFVLINIIDKYQTFEFIEQIIKIIKNVIKNDELIEKFNLIILLFLVKLVFGYEVKDNLMRTEILIILKKFFLNKIKGNTFISLLKIFLPEQILINIFSDKEINLLWIDNFYELPNLIWNENERNICNARLKQTSEYFLEKESNIEIFPQNILESKMDSLILDKINQSENIKELKIENIYVRIYNKEPSFNINRSIFTFLKQMIDSSIKFLKSYSIIKFIRENSNELLINENSEITPTVLEKNEILLKKEFIICLTSVLLVIEQINFNRYNENLIGMTDEKLIETNIIKKILSLHNLFTDNFLNIFDNTIRLCYLQIAYLLSFNKNGQTFILNIDFIKMFEKLLTDESKISNYEFIIVFVLYFKLISLDMTSVETFILKIFDNYIELSNKRIILLKYLQLLIAKIVTIDKFKVLLEEKISKDSNYYKNFSLSLGIQITIYDTKYMDIWRKSPENKESVLNIYKVHHKQFFYEEDMICNNKINLVDNNFPILPLTAISFNDISEINNKFENIFDLKNYSELQNHLKFFDDFLKIN